MEGDGIVTHGSEADCKMDEPLMRKVGFGLQFTDTYERIPKCLTWLYSADWIRQGPKVSRLTHVLPEGSFE